MMPNLESATAAELINHAASRAVSPLASITNLANLASDNLLIRASEVLSGRYDEAGLYRLYMDEHRFLMNELTRRIENVYHNPPQSTALSAIPDRGNTLLSGAA